MEIPNDIAPSPDERITHTNGGARAPLDDTLSSIAPDSGSALVQASVNADDILSLQDLAGRPMWVAWQTEDRDTGKATKVPYAPNGVKAKANDPRTWGTRAQAEEMAAKLAKPYGLGGVGLELHNISDTQRLGGIDLDACRDPVSGQFEPWASAIVQRIGSYTEVSPSGTGVKIFFRYDTADLLTFRAHMGAAAFGKTFARRTGGEHPPAIELHLGNRYFAVTDQRLPDAPDHLRLIETSLIVDLLTVTGPEFAGGSTEPAVPTSPAAASFAWLLAAQPPRDQSRSGAAFRKGIALRRDGATYDAMVEAIRQDPETADWCQEKGEANGQRELRRI